MNSSLSAEVQQQSDRTLTRGVSLNIVSQPKGRALISRCRAKSQHTVSGHGSSPPALPKLGWHLHMSSIYSDVKSSLPPAVLL